MAEDVVLRSSACHREEELLAAQVTVQIGIRWAVGDEKVNIGRYGNLPIHPVCVGEGKDSMTFIVDNHNNCFILCLLRGCSKR